MARHVGIVACSAEGKVMDSTRLLARAAIRKALQEDGD